LQKLGKIPLGAILEDFWDILGNFGILWGIFWFLGYFQNKLKK
jgi:hypothetical protein